MILNTLRSVKSTVPVVMQLIHWKTLTIVLGFMIKIVRLGMYRKFA